MMSRPVPILYIVAALGLVVAIGLAAWFGLGRKEPVVVEEETDISAGAATLSVIGHSVDGRPIEAYTLGSGLTRLLFVGGIHGGYEWNSVVLAYEMLDYLEANANILPDTLSITIIPSANPDGLYDVVGKEGRVTLADAPGADDGSGLGRMNRNGVDLNRNFNCKWQPTSAWRGNEVSAGRAPFSEPEAAAIRDFVLQSQPAAVVFWHSQASAVYASECEAGILPVTLVLMNTYAEAAGYAAVESFDHYPVTGDAEGWLAAVGIPAVTVELSSHTTLDWQKNLAGVKALFEYFKSAP